MKRRMLSVLAVIAVTMSVFSAPSAAQTEETEFSLDPPTVTGGMLNVSGSVLFGTDATGDVTVFTDAPGDATPQGAGFDLTAGKIRTDVKNRRVVFTMEIGDAPPGPADNATPFKAFMWPFSVDGEDRTRWLGATTPGGGNPPATAPTLRLCSNDPGPGWTCPTPLAGSMTGPAVSWTLPFNTSVPGIQFGSVIDGGSILCGVPCSFIWVASCTCGALVPSDSAPFPDAYKVPGEIRIGVAPAGTPQGSVQFTGTATYNQVDDRFAGSVVAPTAPGDYDVWVQSCFGRIGALTCVAESTSLTV